ncbi:MAG: hypothetical protein ABEK50_14535 [bacterium]
MKLTSSELSSKMLQQLQSGAGSSVQLSIATSTLKQSLDNEELVLQLLQSVGKGNRINTEA